jgi:hypothetical protein
VLVVVFAAAARRGEVQGRVAAVLVPEVARALAEPVRRPGKTLPA